MAASEVVQVLSATSVSTGAGVGAMRFGNSDTLGGAPATSYLCPEHLEAISAAVPERVWVAPCPGVMRSLRASVSAAFVQPGETATLLVRKATGGGAAAPTAMTGVFASGGATASDTVNTFAFLAGDRISISCTATHANAKLANVSVTLGYTAG